MPGYFTRIEVAEPHLLPQSVWEQLPPIDKASLTEGEFSSQQWAPLDRRRFRIEPESYRTQSLMANVGALRLSRNSHNRAKETMLRAPGWDGFAISMIERGAGQLILPGSDEPVIGNATTGLIYSVEPGTRLTASDLQRHLFLRLPTMLLRRKLEALLDRQPGSRLADRRRSSLFPDASRRPESSNSRCAGLRQADASRAAKAVIAHRIFGSTRFFLATPRAHDLVGSPLVPGDGVAALPRQLLDQLGARGLVLDQHDTRAQPFVLLAHSALQFRIFQTPAQYVEQIKLFLITHDPQPI